jgi:hypothetical protein
MASQTVQQGWNQATAAMQTTMARGVGGRASGAPRRKARKVKAAKAPKRRASARKAKPARLVKGSAAAKRYMASIRKRR